jgi:copper chaperone NosL
MRLRGFSIFLLLPLVYLTACDGDAVPPPVPRSLTVDAVGYYCNMTVTDHPGPKGQIHRAGGQQPLWFSSVRDAITFTMLPDEAKDVVAIYVHDMGGGRDWSAPSDDGWVEARDAWFVIGSSRRGGMGMAAVVPFADSGEAATFVAKYGGRVVAWQDIPPDYIFNPTEAQDDKHGGQNGSHLESGHEDKSHGPNKRQES